MAVNLSLTEALQAVQTDIGDVATVNDPRNYSKLIGGLGWLLSPQNGRTINTIQQRTANASKYRPVEVRHLPKKGTGDVITSDASASCQRGATRRELIQTLNPTLYVEDKFTIQEEIVREGTQEQLQSRLRREIIDAARNCREDMDRQLLAAWNTGLGANPGASARLDDPVNKGEYANLQLLLSDGTVDPSTFDDIRNDAEDNFMVGDLGIIGLGKYRKYNNLLSVGSAKDSGVDVRGVEVQFGMRLHKSHNTTSGLGAADRIIVPYAGLSQFYQYNLYQGDDFMIDTPDHTKKMSIDDPVFGSALKWDFILKYYDGCDNSGQGVANENGLQGHWVGRVLTYFDLWQVPEEAFGELYGSNLTDFTGTVGYNITQASA